MICGFIGHSEHKYVIYMQVYPVLGKKRGTPAARRKRRRTEKKGKKGKQGLQKQERNVTILSGLSCGSAKY